MSWTLLERSVEAANFVRTDLDGISCRQAAEWFGIAKSTFGDFLNCRHTTRGNRRATIDKLLAVQGWRPETRAALLALRNHEERRLRAKFGPSTQERVMYA